MARRKVTPEFPRTVMLGGARVTAALTTIGEREFVSITTEDGASTDYPLSSLQTVRPLIHKAVFG